MTLIEFLNKTKQKVRDERSKSQTFRQQLKDMLDSVAEDFKLVDANDLCLKLPEGCSSADFEKYLHDAAESLLEIYDAYMKGYISDAVELMTKFVATRQLRCKQISWNDVWFRARLLDRDNRSFKAKEMFHIPFELRSKVVNYRYSISGYPCLYLGSSILACWEELKKPDIYDMCVAMVRLKRGSSISVLDLTVPYDSPIVPLWNDDTEKDERTKNMEYLNTLPLIIACSVRTVTPDDPFKNEYVIPQLLMLSLLKQDKLYGVAYSSAQMDDMITSDEARHYNVAIPVREVSDKGYCSRLKNMFQITRGLTFMEAEIKSVFKDRISTNFEVKDECLYQIIDKNDSYDNYDITKFGQLETFIKKRVEPELVN